jgi:hypothetical protein
MPQIALNPLVGADDGYIIRSLSQFYATTSDVYLGYIGQSLLSWIRFPGVDIAQGTELTSAKLKVRASGSDGGALDVNVYCNAVDDAVAPTNYTEAAALSKTTAYAAWTVPSFTSGNDYEIDITAAVQEIIDREGFSPDNAIMVLIDDGDGAYRRFRHVDVTPATLTIDYATASQTVEVPSANLTLSIPTGILIVPMFAPAASLTLNTYPPSAGLLLQIGSALALALSAETPSYEMDLTKYPNVAALTVLGKLPSYVWSIPANLRPAAQVIYTCTLTGGGESPAVSDLTLPMSSFQGRMRDGDPSYISAVIPNCMIYADDILARQNGDIVIKKGYRFQDGSTQLEEIARVDFESVRIDQGSKSASATISGHKTISSTSVKTVTVEGVSYYCLQADGKRRVRALLDLFLRIGDTCVYGTGVSDYMTVGYITYTVSTNQTIMEVTEA